MKMSPSPLHLSLRREGTMSLGDWVQCMAQNRRAQTLCQAAELSNMLNVTKSRKKNKWQGMYKREEDLFLDKA